MKIDINYNFQAETEPLDADRYSSTLQEYHRILWSKPLPNGKMFNLAKVERNQLHHLSELGEFYLSSDRAIPTFSRNRKISPIIQQIPKEQMDPFNALTETIGGIIVWPSKQVNKKQTINGAKGYNPRISDRLDLTIECIRKFYLGINSPLSDTLERYQAYFDLFDSFNGFIDFFLLQDYVAGNYDAVRVAQPFNNFESSPLPSTVDEYYLYMEHTMKLVEARNRRIDKIFNS